MVTKLDRKKLGIVLAFGVTGLFFISSNIFIPLARKNNELAGELKKNQAKVSYIQAVFNEPSKVEQIKNDTRKLDEFLSKQIPEEGSTNQLAKILQQSAKDFDIAIEVINSENIRQEKQLNLILKSEVSYEVYPLSMEIKAKMPNFIKYVEWLRSQERLITINRLFIANDPREKEFLNISVGLCGYSLPLKNLPYIKAEESPDLDDTTIKLATALPKSKKTDIAYDSLGEIFAARNIESELFPQQPKFPEKAPLELTGIVLKPNRAGSIAIISNRLVKEGDTLDEYRVIGIEEDKVVLEKDREQLVLQIKNSTDAHR